MATELKCRRDTPIDRLDEDKRDETSELFEENEIHTHRVIESEKRFEPSGGDDVQIF